MKVVIITVIVRFGHSVGVIAHAVPLYEAKMVHQFDHRWATYVGDTDESRDMTDEEKADVNRAVQPRYWVERAGVDARLADKNWARGWLLGFRDITNATNERTTIAGIIPLVGCGNKFPLLLTKNTPPSLIACLVGNLASICLDFVARQKIGGTTMNYFYLKQFPLLHPNNFEGSLKISIIQRVLELTYTANDMKSFYEDVIAENLAFDPRTGGERGSAWKWNPERRAILRSELDAIYARLYGLTRDDLRYILDPSDIMGNDYPSETFRGLKAKEIRHLGEYRTRRLVLEAWDKLEQSEL